MSEITTARAIDMRMPRASISIELMAATLACLRVGALMCKCSSPDLPHALRRLGSQILQAIWMGWPWRCFVSIASLLAFVCPTAIFRTIGTVIINAVDGVLGRWSCTYVLQKLFKVIYPLLADIDSAPTVALEFGIARIQTTLLHCCPQVVLGSVTKSVCGVSRSVFQALRREATAMWRRPKTQIGNRHHFLMPANAQACEVPLPAASVTECDDTERAILSVNFLTWLWASHARQIYRARLMNCG
jgi:hypothetical protein